MSRLSNAGAAPVGLRCDATPDAGVGHVVRCLALADELRARGIPVVLLGGVAVPWVRAAVARRDIEIHAAPGDAPALADLAGRLGLRATALDGYDLDPGTGAALRGRGLRVLSLLDGAFGAGQEADVYLDQNLGATAPARLPDGAVALTGPRHVLLRDEVLARRPPPGKPWGTREVPRLLAVFGGTDPYAASPVLVDLVLGTGVPVDVVAVSARAEVTDLLGGVRVGAGQSLRAVGPVDDLAALAAECDAVVTAAGSSVWEFLCIGVPTAVVCVTDNQRLGYDAVLADDLAVRVGELAALRAAPDARSAATTAIADLLRSPERRAVLHARGMGLVDGLGRRRVVDALLGTTHGATDDGETL